MNNYAIREFMTADKSQRQFLTSVSNSTINEEFTSSKKKTTTTDHKNKLSGSKCFEYATPKNCYFLGR